MTSALLSSNTKAWAVKPGAECFVLCIDGEKSYPNGGSFARFIS